MYNAHSPGREGHMNVQRLLFPWCVHHQGHGKVPNGITECRAGERWAGAASALNPSWGGGEEMP